MPATFDAATLALLGAAREVGIAVGSATARPVTIWVVVDGDDVFIRSYRGDAAAWYRAAVASRHAVLHAGDRTIPVSVAPVAAPAMIAAASKAYRDKYACSPYAGDMVRPEILDTTLRLTPI